jgi:hypothetical protein
VAQGEGCEFKPLYHKVKLIIIFNKFLAVECSFLVYNLSKHVKIMILFISKCDWISRVENQVQGDILYYSPTFFAEVNRKELSLCKPQKWRIQYNFIYSYRAGELLNTLHKTLAVQVTDFGPWS